MPFPIPVLVSYLAFAALLLSTPGAWALESNWHDSGKAKVRLVVAGAAPGEVTRAGVDIRLEAGWHTYWRYAGDAGIPPRFDWSGSVNLASAEILWPAPERISVEDGIESIGYYDAVLLPVHVRALNPEKPVTLRLKLDFGVCEKICIPATADVSVAVPPGSGRSHPALDAAEARVPAKAAVGTKGPLGVLAVELVRGAKPVAFVDVAVPPGKPFDLFAEGPADEWYPPLPKRKTFADGRARFAVPLDGATGGGPTPKSLRLTLVSGDKAVDVLAPLD